VEFRAGIETRWRGELCEVLSANGSEREGVLSDVFEEAVHLWNAESEIDHAETQRREERGHSKGRAERARRGGKAGPAAERNFF
jgi:hypothetical protein